MSARIDHTVTSGTFSLDGETFDVDNNVWIVGDDDECVIIDAPHDVAAIAALVGGRTVRAILCTHAHDDHVRVAPELGAAVGAPVLLHPDDLPLWQLTHDIAAGRRTEPTVRRSRSPAPRWRCCTPRARPGRRLLLRPGSGTWCSPATRCSTVAPARPAAASATSRCCSGASPRQLLSLPGQTIVKTGHGDDTTIADERAGILTRLSLTRPPSPDRLRTRSARRLRGHGTDRA